MKFDLPDHKREAILGEFGSSGSTWVDNYSNLLDECVQRWNLELLSVAPAGLAINVIFFCRNSDGLPLVLKIGHPHPEQKTELIALRKYAGRHVVRVLDWHLASGSFVMSRVTPGTQFRDYASDLRRSEIQIPLFKDVSLAFDSVVGLPSYRDWVEKGFAEFRETHPARQQAQSDREFLVFIGRAELVFSSLCARHRKNYLLHGDLHHENILRDDSAGWVAIDPKGVIGPRVMECGRFLHNFMEDEMPGIADLQYASEDQIEAVFKVRFETFSTLMEIDSADIVAAGFVDLVLSSCWCLNSQQKVDLKKIRVLQNLL